MHLNEYLILPQEKVSIDNYREGDLRDDQVNDWLRNKGQFEYSDKAHLGSLNGGIRLLICERLGYKPLGFAMSQSSFLAIEEAFRLPSETLAVLNSNAGEHSAEFNFPLNQAGAPDTVGKYRNRVIVYINAKRC
jgi:hypothetical protein